MHSLMSYLSKLTLLLMFLAMTFILLNNIVLQNNKEQKFDIGETRTQWQRAFDEKFKQIVGGGEGRTNNNKDSFKRRLYIRHRIIDDVGVVIADEQPDLNEIENMTDESRKQQQRRQKHLNKTRQNKQPMILSHELLPSIIEHDPTIDENAVGLSYKYYENSKERIPECSKDSSRQQIALLLLHRTGNQVINNIFYRYGDLNNLKFALPKAPVFQYYWPLRFNPSFVDNSLTNKGKPDLLINPARNSAGKFGRFLSLKTFYLAMLRDPVEHFRNIYELSGAGRFMKLLHPNNTDVRNFVEFTQKPLKNIDKILNVTKRFEPAFHLLKNPQLFDLGYELGDYKTTFDLQTILEQLDEQLSLVLMREYLDESLVLLQRTLCWNLRDMLYLKRLDIVTMTTDGVEDEWSSEETKKNIKKWNREDVDLYQHFNRTFWKRIRTNEDPLFWNDVKELREMNRKINEECFVDSPEIKIRDGVTNETRPICERLALQERDYVTLLKYKQKQRIREEYEAMMRENFKTNDTEEGRFFYVSNMNASDIIKEINGEDGGEKNKRGGDDIESELVDILKL